MADKDDEDSARDVAARVEALEGVRLAMAVQHNVVSDPAYRVVRGQVVIGEDLAVEVGRVDHIIAVSSWCRCRCRCRGGCCRGGCCCRLFGRDTSLVGGRGRLCGGWGAVAGFGGVGRRGSIGYGHGGVAYNTCSVCVLLCHEGRKQWNENGFVGATGDYLVTNTYYLVLRAYFGC